MRMEGWRASEYVIDRRMESFDTEGLVGMIEQPMSFVSEAHNGYAEPSFVVLFFIAALILEVAKRWRGPQH